LVKSAAAAVLTCCAANAIRVLTSQRLHHLKKPGLDVSIKRQATRRLFLTLEEPEELAATPCSNQDTKAAFLFSAFSGLRYSDVKALTWGQVSE
jgi:integrase